MTVLPAGPAPGALAPSRYRSPIQYDEVAAEVPVGVVVPFDFALDWEYWRWLPAGVALHFSRTPFLQRDAGMYLARSVSRPSTVDRVARTLRAVHPAAMLYACTSGSFVGGVAGEAALREAMHTAGCARAVTSSGAAVAALRLAGAERVAVATPYSGSLTRHLVSFLDEAGIGVASADYLGLHRGIASVSQSTIIDLVRQAGSSGADAVFVSCTSLRTYGTVSQLEGELGIPVFTSNQVSLWAVLVAAGVLPRPADAPDPGWVLGGGDPMARSTRILMDGAASADALLFG
ncbi:hypothetical protein PO878_02760 [Iamia majanohamensis]|uniref:Maleate isomerase n=1 Tax=Iamia majanohamensis TaxID=467976 RepID=A0AAF0BUA4_9ACTN|nr:hypothetical protein [Iamia majanohamensis]WCO67642.1 hypothetical protein PO878_02760 [Iamia majanohamensis]